MKRFIIVMLSALMLFSFSSAAAHQAENKHSSFADDLDTLKKFMEDPKLAHFFDDIKTKDWAELEKIQPTLWKEIMSNAPGKLLIELIFSSKNCNASVINNILDAGLPASFRGTTIEEPILSISLRLYNHEAKAPCIKTILERGADPNEIWHLKDKYYQPAFKWPLLLSSPDPDADLTNTLSKDYIGAMKLLCEYGADLTIRDSRKMSGWDYVDAFNIDRNNLQECLENEKAP